ncbi:adhesion G-protein coupled receptor G6-like [Clytia hemisphaerica]|uniref:adhesion G-protein coupled receptor G6-like n=1 Tax=Clytia hemisphaerica TaxID=252671 RepID=UPI0034D741E8|eukprot:TCONS_00053650-protein
MYIFIKTLIFLFTCTQAINAIDFVQKYTLSNVDKINGKDCEKWTWKTDAPQSTDKQICFNPKSDKILCNLELPQFKPPKTPDGKITNLILEFDYIPDVTSCTGRCGIKHSLLVYLKESQPQELSDVITGTKSKTVKRTYHFENPDNINGIYFRMTPIDYCGRIRNVKLYIDEIACKKNQLELAEFPNFLKDEINQQSSVIGQCIHNAVPTTLGTQPSAECDAQNGVYNVKSGCVCDAGHQKIGSECIVCPNGYFKIPPGNTPCLKCGLNSMSLHNFTSCKCLSGYHRDENVGELGEPSTQDCVEKKDVSADFCLSEIVNHLNMSQYIFPKTVNDQTITLPCGANYDGVVTRDCVFDGLSGKSFWTPVIWSCVRILPNTIEELLEIPITTENMVMVSRTLTDITSNQTSLETPSDVVKVTMLMKECLNMDSQTVKEKSQKKEVVMNVLATLDNILHLNTTILSTSSNNKQILDVIASVAKNSLDNPVSYNGPEFTFATAKVSDKRDLKAIITSDPDSSTCKLKTMEVQFTDLVTTSNKTNTQTSKMVEIFIPKSILKNQNISSANMIVHVFRKDKIFPQEIDKEITSNNLEKRRIRKVTSLIMATSLYNKSISNTKEKIKITFKLKTMGEAKNALCTYWQEDKDTEKPGFWSPRGCIKSNIITTENEEIYVVCSCTHLTNFAVLFNVYDAKVGAIKSNTALNIISFIGCVVSMVCLIATLICYLGLRDIRRRTARKILINFCFSLLFLLSTFMFGIEQTARPHVCHAVSALIHMFTLSTFFWMSVQAVFLYLSGTRCGNMLRHALL